MRRPKVVANVALIAMLAAVAVPGPVGSQAIRLHQTPSADVFAKVEMDAAVRGPVTTTQPLDPGARSDGNLDQGSTLFEPTDRNEPLPARSAAAQPKAKGGSVSKHPWRHDPEISWYGPGLIGNGTACGQTLTRSLVGVAHRTLPCGTKVTFRHNGRVVRVPVIDRGPYVGAREYDLTAATARKLGFSGHGPIQVTK